MDKPTRSSDKPKGIHPTFLADFIPHWLDLGSWIKGGAFFLVGFIGALILGWFIFPMALYSETPQPMNFNHAIHLSEDVGIEGETEVERCGYCHGFRDDGTFKGIPKLAVCMDCHEDPESPYTDSADEQVFLTQYVATGTEIPWLSYYRQPDCVYFSHIAHVKMAELACRDCHGDHGTSKKLPVYKRNRLSGYSINIWGRHISGYKKNPWDRMKMDDCAECHTETGNETNNACIVCHK